MGGFDELKMVRKLDVRNDKIPLSPFCKGGE
jgi:hypothetical protein